MTRLTKEFPAIAPSPESSRNRAPKLSWPSSSTSITGDGQAFPSICAPANAWPQRHTEIAIQFKRMPFELFRNAPFHKLHTNTLVIQIQPVEGISLSFGAKIPGPGLARGLGRHEL